MSKERFDLRQIEASLKADDNKALNYIYTKYGKYCINQLVSVKSCSVQEAEDLFVEAVMIFREKVLNKEIQYLKNTRYYIYKICENRYLARLKLERSRQRELSEIEHFYYSSNYLKSDDELDQNLLKATIHAWSNMKERCKDIIYYFYVDQLRMTEIADLMDLANADVAKSTKARCFKYLVTTAYKYYEKLIKSYSDER
ncbi:MAG: hypothetical protein AAF843_10470 [Bacteroidota bacterium]